MTDTLHQEPERDQFKTESPIRAFTTWTVQGLYALGKGFRPSLAHLVPYLHAMESKEGWQLVQVLEAGTQTPSFIFRQSLVIPDEVLIDRLRGDDGFKQSIRDLLNDEEPFVRNREDRFVDDVDPASRDPLPPAEAIGGDRTVEDCRSKFEHVPLLKPGTPLNLVSDDPINPKHYGGTACAEIGELLSANSYQMLRYNWRLGEKDEPCQEIDKSLWYLDREIALIVEGHTFIPGDHRLPDHAFFDRRLEDRSEHTKEVARKLISWNRYGKVETLRLLRKLLQDKRATFTCGDVGRGLAI